jgi:uncharacterized membrane protein YkoI
LGAMVRSLRAFLVGIAILAAGPIGPAAAQCLSTSQAREAVSSGQILSLSKVIGQVRSVAGGEVLSSPQLCQVNGRYIYRINVLTSGGTVMNVVVDAHSGSILSY